MAKLKRLGPGLRPGLKGGLDFVSDVQGLPPILGQWYFVDPTDGADSQDGKSAQKALADLDTAYARCTSGAGDGICLLARGTSSAGTTSRQSFPLVWSKHGITVFGVSSGARQFNRARVSNEEHTTGAITTIAFGADTITITDSASGFVTAGFEVGDVLRIDTTSNTNDGTTDVITAVTAGTITCSASSFTEETAAAAGSTTINSYPLDLIQVTGDNNRFENLSIVNHSSDAAAIGGLSVGGNRNAFHNVHVIGAGHATPGAVADAYDLKVHGEENSFEGCTFGTSSVLSAAANSNVLFDTNSWRNNFYDCDFQGYSETAGRGAINSADATAIEGWTVFARCRFFNFYTNGITDLTSAFIGTALTSGYLLMDSCSLAGWAAWDSVGGNNNVYVANSDATASGAGGIATTV